MSWKNKNTQRAFLEQLAIKLDIVQPQTWGKVTLKTVIENGGNSLLKQHKSSLKRALKHAYPGINCSFLVT